MITNKFNYTALSRHNVDGKRHYLLPDGRYVPSVTTILDFTKPLEKKQALMEWRKAVGEQKAQQITTEAANRGTRMHSYLESYILMGDMKQLPSNPYAHQSWFMAAKVILEGLPNVTEYWGVEVPLYASGLYAGTSDLIGKWKGKPAIMDFKQTNKPKKREFIDDYFLQLAAYAMAHNDVHGTDIKTGAIMMAVKPVEIAPNEYKDPEYQEFEIGEEEFAYWTDEWMKRVELYHLSN